MPTEIEVVNMALALLEEAPIDALSDNNKIARLSTLHYAQTRKAELAKHPWAFATITASISGAQTGIGTMAWAYTLPSDCLRVLPVTETGATDGVPLSWEVRAGKVYTTKSTPLILRYIQDVTDPDDWDAAFVDVVAAALATKVVLPLTHKASLIPSVREAYSNAFAEAQRVAALHRGSIMPSSTDIANLALGLIDEAPIDNLEQDNRSARLVKLHYDDVRKAEITKHIWTFALATSSLTGTDSGEEGLSWSYTIPADCLRPLPLTYDGEPDGIPISWEVRGTKIYTDQESPRILHYIKDVTDTTLWDATFRDVVIAALAAKIALPLTKNAGIVQLAEAAYQKALSEALRVNAVRRGSLYYGQGWPLQRGDNRYWRA